MMVRVLVAIIAGMTMARNMAMLTEGRVVSLLTHSYEDWSMFPACACHTCSTTELRARNIKTSARKS